MLSGIKPETKEIVVILPDKSRASAELHISDEDPETGLVEISIAFAGRELNQRGADYFSTLVAIREMLETENILLTCYGASRNIYPSPMSRSMGSGEKAYRLTLGQPARSNDLVSIFDVGPDVEPATVVEQAAFYQKWLKSLAQS